MPLSPLRGLHSQEGKAGEDGLFRPSGTFPRGEGYEGKASSAFRATSPDGKAMWGTASSTAARSPFPGGEGIGWRKDRGIAPRAFPSVTTHVCATFRSDSTDEGARKIGKEGFDSGTYEERDGV